jgi:tetratricopeptide (TPR) repeat protein
MRISVKIILAIVMFGTFVFAQSADAIFDRGLANLRSQKYVECVSDFKSYIAKQPDSPGAHYNLGLCNANLNKHSEAAAAYREATRLNPEYYDAFVQLGNELDTSGLYADAVVAYNKAIAIESDNSLAHLELAVAHNNAKKYQQSTASYQRVLELEPQNIRAIHGLGLIYYNQKNQIALKKQIEILRPLDETKTSDLEGLLKEISSVTTVKPLIKKPVVKTARRIADEKAVAGLKDFGFDAALVTGVGSIRETAAKTGKFLLAVKRTDLLSLVDRNESNGFYKVVEEKSGIEGWIDGNSVVIKLTENTENSSPPLNDDGEGESVLANPLVSISNGEAKTTLKIRLNGTLYLIPPQSTKVVSVSPGKFTYYGWSPGIRPTSGKSTLIKGRKYSWSFKIYRR